MNACDVQFLQNIQQSRVENTIINTKVVLKSTIQMYCTFKVQQVKVQKVRVHYTIQIYSKLRVK